MRQNILPIQFLSRENVLFPSLDDLCSSENLCDVKIVCQGGNPVFMHRAVLRLCVPELIDNSPTEYPTVILLPDEVSSHVEEARRKLYLHGAQEEICRVLQTLVVCKEESINPMEMESDVTCDILGTNADNEDRNKTINQALYEFEDTYNTRSPQMTDDIKAFLEQKLKRRVLAERKDNVEDVKFFFLNTKLRDSQTRNWRPELGNLVTHDKYIFHLNQLIYGSKKQSWVCRFSKAQDPCMGKASTSEDDSGKRS